MMPPSGATSGRHLELHSYAQFFHRLHGLFSFLFLFLMTSYFSLPLFHL